MTEKTHVETGVGTPGCIVLANLTWSGSNLSYKVMMDRINVCVCVREG